MRENVKENGAERIVFRVRDDRTGEVLMGRYDSRRTAIRVCDKKNNAYGAYAYSVVSFAEPAASEDAR